MLQDKENAQLIIQVVTDLNSKGIDSRQMAYLKMGFVRKDKENSGKMKIKDFKGVLKSIIKSDDPESHQKIIEFVKADEGTTDDDLISFEKLNTLIEVY